MRCRRVLRVVFFLFPLLISRFLGISELNDSAMWGEFKYGRKNWPLGTKMRVKPKRNWQFLVNAMAIRPIRMFPHNMSLGAKQTETRLNLLSFYRFLREQLILDINMLHISYTPLLVSRLLSKSGP